MTPFPECPTCSKRALHRSTATIGREVVLCAHCQHVPRQSSDLMADALEAMEASPYNEESFRELWAVVAAREREKVARLQEGRW